jgi:integrase
VSDNITLDLYNDLKFAEKIGLKPLHTDEWTSNLATPTDKKVAFRNREAIFIKGFSPVPDNSTKYPENETRKRPRTPLKSLCGFPYYPAALIPEDPKDQVITRDWCIRFYAWDIALQKLVRVRILKKEFRELPDVQSRLDYAKDRIDRLNYFLKNNYHLESRPIPKIKAPDFGDYSLVRALSHAIKYKQDRVGVAESTIGSYNTVLEDVKAFLEHKKLSPSYPLSRVNFPFIDLYFEYLTIHRKVANSTHNWYRGMLHSLFEVLIKQSGRKLLSGLNPIEEIEKLETPVYKHAAYSGAQLKAIVDLALERGDLDVVLYIQFMYYTLARPNEVRHLKVGHINMQLKQILFLVENAKTKYEEYVGINERFAKIITGSGILQYPGNYYVFSIDQVRDRPVIIGDHHRLSHEGRVDQKIFGPGLRPVGQNYFPDKIRGYIADLELHLVNENYTPYGIKHTGAIDLYRATKDIEIVKTQCRHKTLEATIKYLRDLGVFTDFDQLNKWEGPV